MELGLLLTTLFLQNFAQACDIPHVLRTFLENIVDASLESVPFLTSRDAESCRFADGSSRNYSLEGDWKETPFPNCNLPIKFHLFRPSIADPAIISAVNIEPSSTSFKKSMSALKRLLYKQRPLFFITHGFMSATIPPWAYSMKDAMISIGYNVVLVEWYSMWKTYLYAIADTRIVSDVMAVFIDELIRLQFVSDRQIVLVGFSLGAHICGMVAQKVEKAKIKAIIGLDPAGPFFDCYPDLGLTKHSAHFVQALHTDAEGLPFHFGTDREIGHIDYYVNPGQGQQPGCLNPFQEVSSIIGCSHQRANTIFTEILKSHMATECTRLNKTASTYTCQLLARSACHENDINCDSDPIKVLSLWRLLSYTLGNVKIDKMGRFEVFTTSNNKNLCGLPATITIEFSTTVSIDYIQLTLIDDDEIHYGPINIAVPANSKEVVLKLSLAPVALYTHVEIRVPDQPIPLSMITVQVQEDYRTIKYSTEMEEKTIEDEAMIVPLKLNARDSLKK